MRLIDAHTHQLVEFFDADIPPYAILSHKWGSADDELSYSDYVKDRKRNTAGRRKIDDFCRVAAELNYGWVWVDTCSSYAADSHNNRLLILTSGQAALTNPAVASSQKPSIPCSHGIKPRNCAVCI